MSYCIALRIFQSNPARGHFRIVEQTVFNYANGGTWSRADGVLTLTMGGSGTSGVIRLMSDRDELLAVTVGVHNYKRFCDIVTDLAPDATALVINQEYYNNGPRTSVREQQLAQRSVTSASDTKVEINFTAADGKKLAADIIIG